MPNSPLHYSNIPVSVMTTAERTGAGFVQLPDAVRLVYSQEIVFASQPALKFAPFAMQRTELSDQPGKVIAMPKLGNIRRGGRLIEGERIKTQGINSSMAYIQVAEQGNAIKVSELLLQSSFYDQMEIASFLLGKDMAITLDLQIRDAALRTNNLVRGATALGGSTEATARNLIAGQFDTRVINDMVETLETNNSPRFEGDYYVCFIHPHQARTLRDDPDWIEPQIYAAQGTNIFNGELGRYNDVRFIRTTVMPNGANGAIDPQTNDFVDLGYDAALDGTGASSAKLYQSVMLGENAVGFATALPVELRDDGVKDFGREHSLAWYAIWGVDLIENMNAVVAETA